MELLVVLDPGIVELSSRTQNTPEGGVSFKDMCVRCAGAETIWTLSIWTTRESFWTVS